MVKHSIKEWNDMKIIFMGKELTVTFNNRIIHKGNYIENETGSFYLCPGARNIAWFDNFAIYQ